MTPPIQKVADPCYRLSALVLLVDMIMIVTNTWHPHITNYNMFNVTGGQSIDINRTVPDSRLLLRAFLIEKCIKALPEPKIERWTSFSTDTLALTPPITQSTAWVLRQTASYNLGDRLQTGFTLFNVGCWEVVLKKWALKDSSQYRHNSRSQRRSSA